MDDLTIDARKQELLEARFLGLPKVSACVRLQIWFVLIEHFKNNGVCCC